MKKLILYFCLCLLSFSTFGQLEFDKDEFLKNVIGTIESDRPGQALNATTCGVLAFQIQTGFNYTRLINPFGGNSRNQSVPTNVRFGLSDVWELNTSFSFQNQNLYNGLDHPINSNGFPSPNIGIRAAFLKGENWKPFLAIQANLSVPSSRGTFMQPKFGSSFYLVTSNRFEHISVNTTVGVLFGGNGGGISDYPYVLNIGTMITKKIGTFVEAFGSMNNQTLNVDGGFSFLATSNLQLDIFGGWLEGKNWFAEAGISWRLSLFQRALKKNISNLEKILE